jgi:hypothetical protein
MWIVQLALRRPYTFIVASILILVLGLTSIATTPADITNDTNLYTAQLTPAQAQHG